MIDVSLLGRVSVAVDGAPLTGEAAQRRRLALLALLSVPTPHPLSRDRAMLFLWPDSDTASARHLLSVAVHVLRRALGHEALLTTGDEISLAADAVRVDVAAFEDALRRGEHEEALGPYGGPFMDGFHAGAGPELEQWIDAERTRLERSYAQALEGAAAARRAFGDLPGAVEAWRKRVLIDPYSGHGALGLMRALAEAGDRAAAIRHAGVHRQLLDAELGAAADPEVEALAEELRAEATMPAATPVLAVVGSAGSAAAVRSAAAVPQAAGAAPASERRGSAPGPEVTPAAAAEAGASAAQGPGREGFLAPPVARVPAARHLPLPRRLARRWRELALGVLLVMITVYVVQRWWAGPRTVAVPPCDDTSLISRPEKLGDAIAHDINDALRGVRGLQLASTRSAFALRDSKIGVREVGQRLGVQWVVDCSVEATAAGMKLSASLSSARDGFQYWGASWNAPSSELAEEVDSIARGVAATLGAQIEPGAVSAGSTKNLDAYDLYQAGRSAWLERTPGSLEQATKFYRQALAKDSSYARAWAGLALTLIVQGSYDYGALRPDSAFHMARLATQRALSIAPSLSDAHLALAGVYMNYDWRLAEAEKEFRLAIDADAGNSTARQWHALMLAAEGDTARALVEMMRSGEGDPTAAQRVQLAHLFYYRRQYDRSVAEAQRALALDSTYPRALMVMAMAEIQRGNAQAAVGILEALRARAQEEPAVVGALGYARARAGQRDSALECRGWLLRARQKRYVPAELVVLIDVGLNERAHALQGLGEAFRANSNGMIYLSAEPAMDSLRADPAFARMVRDVAAGRPAVHS